MAVKMKTVSIIFTIFVLLIPDPCIACTVVEQGSGERKPCQFPFRIQGIEYKSCTSDFDPSGISWCSTKVEGEVNDHVNGGDFWGHCTERNCFTQKQTIANGNDDDDPDVQFSDSVPEVPGEISQICGLRLNSEVRFVAGGPVIGRNNPRGHWPWMVSIGYFDDDANWVHQCGGTVISREHVLTAAHCAYDDTWLLRFGEADLGETYDDVAVEVREIKRTDIHPDFKAGKAEAYYDVAVMTILGKPLRFNRFVIPICLPDSPSDDPDEYAYHAVTVLGFGRTARGNTSNSELRRAQLTIYPKSHCDDTHDVNGGTVGLNIRTAVPHGFTDAVICAGYEIGGPGSCKGDSGGPIVQYMGRPTNRYVQIGIVFGAVSECGSPNFPGIYANLANPSIYWFIKEATGDKKLPQPQPSVQPTTRPTPARPSATTKPIPMRSSSTTRTTTQSTPSRTSTGQLSPDFTDIYGTEISYEGDMDSNGMASGYGVAHVQNATNGELRFEGQWRDGELNGKGKLEVLKNGATYDGDFANGIAEGNGTTHFANGDIYVGGFKNDVRDGYGVQTFACGGKYVGYWKNDLYHGQGRIKYCGGKMSYVGRFHRGKRQGRGTLTFSNGDTYNGSFDDDLMQGTGTYFDGLWTYVGQYEKGQAVGKHSKSADYLGSSTVMAKPNLSGSGWTWEKIEDTDIF